MRCAACRATPRRESAGWPMRSMSTGVDVGLSTSLTMEMFSDVDAIVHLVGIIQEAGAEQTFQRIHVYGTENVIDVAKRAGVHGRFVYMSAIGSSPDAPAEYSRTKFAAEQAVQSSGLPYTIFRPSLVIGPDGEFVAQMGDLVKHGGLPFADPVPGHPRSRLRREQVPADLGRRPDRGHRRRSWQPGDRQ